MKTITEYIDESLFLTGLAAGLVGWIIGTTIACFANYFINDVSPKETIAAPITVVKQWMADKKAKKIIEKLSQDQDVKDFFNQSKYKQRGKWLDLLKTKLTEDEYKYIKHITKNRVNSAINA